MKEGARRLPANEIVARYVGGSHVDTYSGKINGSAFERTPKDIDGVSVTRRGIFNADQEKDRADIRAITASRLTLGKTAVFAEIGVGESLDVLKEFEQDIYFCEDPLAAEGKKLANPGHALVMGFPFKDEKVGSLKSEVAGDRLRQCILDQFPAVLPDKATDGT